MKININGVTRDMTQEEMIELERMAAEAPVPESVIENVNTSVIIASSTKGSTKRFRITIDDSGTIAATEVT